MFSGGQTASEGCPPAPCESKPASLHLKLSACAYEKNRSKAIRYLCPRCVQNLFSLTA